MKYGRMAEWRQQYPVAMMCRVFDVSESGYHAWRDRPFSRRAQENARLEVEIRAAHQRTRETCGPERLQSDLVDHGIRAGVDRIKRIRKKPGLRCKQKKKFKVTTSALGSRQPVLRARLPEDAGTVWHDGIHEPQRRLLG